MRHRVTEVTKLLFKSARMEIEFTRDGWKQLLRHNTSPVSAFIQAINIKADLALYITAHEEKGFFMALHGKLRDSSQATGRAR